MSTQIQAYDYKPTSFEQLWKFAEIISNSDLAPKDFKGKAQNAFIAMQMGGEVGLNPMQSIQNIAVINGRPCMYGDALLALAQAHPAYEWINETITGEGMEKMAVCEIKRKNAPVHTAKFSVADAKQAGLWGKAGPWSAYPGRMLQMRARGFALRNTFADALKGISSAEEVQDIPVSRGEVEVVPSDSQLNQGEALEKYNPEALLKCETMEELKDEFERIYQHAKYTKDADLFKAAVQLKDERKAQLEFVDELGKEDV